MKSIRVHAYNFILRDMRDMRNRKIWQASLKNLMESFSYTLARTIHIIHAHWHVFSQFTISNIIIHNFVILTLHVILTICYMNFIQMYRVSHKFETENSMMTLRKLKKILSSTR